MDPARASVCWCVCVCLSEMVLVCAHLCECVNICRYEVIKWASSLCVCVAVYLFACGKGTKAKDNPCIHIHTRECKNGRHVLTRYWEFLASLDTKWMNIEIVF